MQPDDQGLPERGMSLRRTLSKRWSNWAIRANFVSSLHTGTSTTHTVDSSWKLHRCMTRWFITVLSLSHWRTHSTQWWHDQTKNNQTKKKGTHSVTQQLRSIKKESIKWLILLCMCRVSPDFPALSAVNTSPFIFHCFLVSSHSWFHENCPALCMTLLRHHWFPAYLLKTDRLLLRVSWLYITEKLRKCVHATLYVKAYTT